MHILIFSYVTKIGLLIFRKEGQYYYYYFTTIPVAEQPNCDICNSIPYVTMLIQKAKLFYHPIILVTADHMKKIFGLPNRKFLLILHFSCQCSVITIQ